MRNFFVGVACAELEAEVLRAYLPIDLPEESCSAGTAFPDGLGSGPEGVFFWTTLKTAAAAVSVVAPTKRAKENFAIACFMPPKIT